MWRAVKLTLIWWLALILLWLLTPNSEAADMPPQYRPVNVDAWEYIDPLALKAGLEAAAISCDLTQALYVLCTGQEQAPSIGGWPTLYTPDGELVVGRWAGDRIIVASSYSSPDAIFDGEDPIGHTLYTLTDPDQYPLVIGRSLQLAREIETRPHMADELGTTVDQLMEEREQLMFTHAKRGFLRNITPIYREWHDDRKEP